MNLKLGIRPVADNRVLAAGASPLTIRRQLNWLVAACVVPAVLAAALLTVYSYERQRKNIELATLETAEALAEAVDRQLASGQTALQALATSPYLASGDLAAFHREALEALRDLPGSNIKLSDGAGRQLVNTLRRFGGPLPAHGNLEQLHRVFETGRPAISDLYVGPVSGRRQISIDVPVRQGDTVVYDLSMAFFPARLGEILTRQALPEGWVGSIFDSQGRIVARTHDTDRYVGQRGAAELLRHIARAREGSLQIRTLEGIPVTAVFTHSALSGWSVAIGIPTSVIALELWTPILILAAAAIILLAAGLTLAQRIAGRIAHSVTALVAPATALGRGERAVVPPLDVSEAVQVGRVLTSASQLLRDREHVLAVVAHDLRSPLSTLSLRSELIAMLAKKMPGGERMVEESAILTDVARRMAGMVDDLLAVAVSANTERSMLKLAPVDASSLVTRAANSVRELFAQHGIELRVEASRILPSIDADADRVLRVFVNLLDNARKFTARRGQVVLRAEAQPHVVRFSIANSGPALAPEEVESLFRPFWQARGDDRRGAGLGLSICRSIVETHGGCIWAEREPGKRVRICFELPRAPGDASLAATPGRRARS
jgi:signal transduction histidine kinase